MNLFYRESGEGIPLIILHGLFGSSDNWHTISKVFAQQYHVFTIDQRNHGQSPHDNGHNYKLLTADLEEFIAQHNLKQPIVMGHSMGGKTAMNFAVKNPLSLSKLIVVDIIPKVYPVHHDHILEGMKSLVLENLTSRSEADQLLAQHISNADVRQFILKNMSRGDQGKFEWKINLPVLDKEIESMGEAMQYKGKFEGPTLFIKGSKSDYFSSGDEKIVADYFPKAQWVTLEASHWVQAEQPEAFAEAVTQFLSS